MAFMNKRAVFGWLAFAALVVFSSSLLSAQGQPANAEAGGGAEQSQGNGRPFVAGRMLIKFHSEVTDLAAHEILESERSECEKDLTAIGVHIVRLPNGAEESGFVEKFNQRPEVDFAELDHITDPQATIPNDTRYPDQWALPKIDAPNAWDIETGSSSIIIALIDTGVDSSHEDLDSKMVAGFNIYNNNTDTTDITGHGTLMAGVVSAETNNGRGVASPCWNCRIMPIRVSDSNGFSTSSRVASGLTWAADNGARVAVVGYNFNNDSTVTSAAEYFKNLAQGVVILPIGNFVAWNDPNPDNPHIVTVSATDVNDQLLFGTSTGNNVDLSAPGHVISTVDGGGYTTTGVGGSCYASALVGSVAGLVLSKNPSLNASGVLGVLTDSADDLGASGWDNVFGHGRLNALAAVEMAGSGGGDTTPPSVVVNSPSEGATVSGTVQVAASASDSGTGVDRVVFKVGASTICTDFNSPYNCSWDTTTTSNGSKNVTATAFDNAGNQASDSNSVTVDNPVPDSTPPAVTLTSPAEGATVSGTVTVAASASDSESGMDRVVFKVGGATICTDTSSPYSCSWNTTTVSDGAKIVTATAFDIAGNQASDSNTVTVENSSGGGPTVTITSPSSGATVSGTTIVSAAASGDTRNVQFTVGTTLICTDRRAPYSCSWNTTGTPDGQRTLTATATDADGNTGSHSISVVVDNDAEPGDTTPPAVSLTAPAQGATVSGTVSVSASASDSESGMDRVVFQVGGSTICTDFTAPYGCSWNTTTTSNGSKSVTATAFDNAGNSASDTHNVTVSNGSADTTPPSVAITSPPNGSTVHPSGRFTVNAAASDNVGVQSVTFSADGDVCTDTTAPYSCDLRVSKGQHTVTATARDAAGNTATAAISVIR